MTTNQSKYRILGLVGRGQFGRVFCARDRQAKNQANNVGSDQSTGNLVALKELEQRRFPTNQFLRELRFLISLRHVNIVNCISLDYSQNRRYLVMEYCEAGTLRSLIEARNLIENRNLENLGERSLNQDLNLVIEILSGLKYAHELNIVHCDIKPENILLKLTRTGWQAKISDFGIAKLAIENDKSDRTGSPGYMAPERFYGQFSKASDLYAVGIILYELLIGERPFSGNPAELMYGHLNHRVKVPDFVPEALKKFLYKSLEKLPARRFNSAEVMQTELELIISKDFSKELIKEFANQKLSDGIVKPKQIIEIPKLETLNIFVTEKKLLKPILALGFCDRMPNSLNFYSANETLLKKRNLLSIFNLKTSYQFNDGVNNINEKIIDIVITKNQEYVITNYYIYIVIDNFQSHRVLYAFNQPANQSVNQKWAIADKWLCILNATQFNEINETKQNIKLRLEIQYLSNIYPIKILDLPALLSKVAIVDLLIISLHHLALVSNTTEGSNISVISRRGNIMANFDLPVAIVMAIASYETGKILVVTELNYLLLIDWKPYRVSRIELGYRPQFIKATNWGYIIVLHEQSDTFLNFMDAVGNQVGGFSLDGLVIAIACISNNILVISVKDSISSLDANLANTNYEDSKNQSDNQVGGRLLILDLKQLNLDLVF